MQARRPRIERARLRHDRLSRQDGESARGIAWVTNLNENTVSEIEASSGAVIRKIAVGSPFAVSSDGTHVWVANISENTVSEISTSFIPVCTSNTAKITLTPGLTDTAAVQTIKIKGTLTGCTGAPAAKYTATVKTAGPVSCSVLATAGEPVTATAKYVWTPKAKGSTGTLSMPFLTETPGISFSGEAATGSYSPLTFTGTATQSYADAATCGLPGKLGAVKPVKKGTLSGSAVNFS